MEFYNPQAPAFKELRDRYIRGPALSDPDLISNDNDNYHISVQSPVEETVPTKGDEEIKNVPTKMSLREVGGTGISRRGHENRSLSKN